MVCMFDCHKYNTYMQRSWCEYRNRNEFVLPDSESSPLSSIYKNNQRRTYDTYMASVTN